MPAVAWLLAFLVAFSHAPAALAHATLLRSDPSDGAVVAQAPSMLTLTFNEPVSPISLKLMGEGGHTVELRGVTARGEALIVTLPGPLPEGTHLLSWRVISADGHPVGGALTFSVGRLGAAALRRQGPSPTVRCRRRFGLRGLESMLRCSAVSVARSTPHSLRRTVSERGLTGCCA